MKISGIFIFSSIYWACVIWEDKSSYTTKVDDLYTLSGFDITVLAIIIFFNVTNSRVLKYSYYLTLAYPEEESLLFKQKYQPWKKAPFKNPGLYTRENTRKQSFCFSSTFDGFTFKWHLSPRPQIKYMWMTQLSKSKFSPKVNQKRNTPKS